MKLSLVFELLLIFILLAFAASKSVKHEKHHIKKLNQRRNTNSDEDKIGDNNINKYCKCVESYCNCCKDFRLPVVELNGPGCASLMYLNGDKMSVSLSFGKKVITNRTLSSRKPSPVCMPLPGGLSKFCGRVYNIARAGEEFRACLGLELQTKKIVEAAVRVSCFKFGPRGVSSEPADPLPLVPKDEKNDDEDDDDDYDDDVVDFGLGGGGDDDEDEDDDDDDDDEDIAAVNDIESADYTGFSLLGDDLLGDLFGSTDLKEPKPKKKQSVKKQAPTSTTTTTTKRPKRTRRPSRRPSTRTTTLRPIRTTTSKTQPPGTRRPTRKPSHNRRPTRKPTTESTSTSVITTTFKPTALSTTVQTAEFTQMMNTVQEDNAVLPSANDEDTSVLGLAATTPKSVTEFDDAGLEMSLAHITGQLSALPVTPMIADESKQSILVTKAEQPTYEKIQTITHKTPLRTSTISMAASDEDMIQIVQNLDSFETTPENEPIFGEDSRGHDYHGYSFLQDDFDGLTAPEKPKPKNKQFDLDDLDVLNLSKIGESLGDELGIFGKNKKQRDVKKTKLKGEKDDGNDYDDLVDAIGHTLMMRKSDKEIRNKKDRRRQNKMMRGEWSSQPIAS